MCPSKTEKNGNVYWRREGGEEKVKWGREGSPRDSKVGGGNGGKGQWGGERDRKRKGRNQKGAHSKRGERMDDRD